MSKARTGAVCMILGAALGAAALVPFLGAAKPANATTSPHALAETPELTGRYLVQIAGCNDCHTPGFQMLGDKVPEAQWLTGVGVGFKGPWGTSYAPNLRTKAQALTREQWVTFAKNQNGRPPMPWASLHAMSEEDLGNLYAFIRSLGPSDSKVPAPLDPGVTPTTPYIVFEPVMPK